MGVSLVWGVIPKGSVYYSHTLMVLKQFSYLFIYPSGKVELDPAT